MDDLAFFDDVRQKFEERKWEPDTDEWRSSTVDTKKDEFREERQIEALFARFTDS